MQITSPTVNVVDDAGVRLISFDRPEKLNAMTAGMYDELRDLLIDAGLRPDVSCVVLTGRGRAFCTGWDLAELRDPPSADDGRRHGPVPCIEELIRFEKPLLGACNGLAVGFGATTMLHCDLVVAGHSARFQFPFVRLGLAGEAACSVTLPMRVGYQEAARLLFTAEWIDGPQAVEAGLAWRCVPDEELLPVTMGIARAIAQMPLEAVVATKRLLLAGRLEPVRSALEREITAYDRLLGGPANQAAVQKLLTQRTPRTGDRV